MNLLEQFVNKLEHFVNKLEQFVNKLGQFVKIARAVVEPNWWWGGCVVAFAAGVLVHRQRLYR